MGLGIPAVGGDKVHKHLSPGTGQKEPPGRESWHIAGMDQIKAKSDTCF